jgi:hypothetical protein
MDCNPPIALKAGALTAPAQAVLAIQEGRAAEPIAYKPLAANYRKNGYDYALIDRTERVALYRQSDASGFKAFEVCRVLRHEGRTIGGAAMPPAEFLPSTEQWGQQAWTFLALGKAYDKYHEQNERLAAR